MQKINKHVNIANTNFQKLVIFIETEYSKLFFFYPNLRAYDE